MKLAVLGRHVAADGVEGRPVGGCRGDPELLLDDGATERLGQGRLAGPRRTAQQKMLASAERGDRLGDHFLGDLEAVRQRGANALDVKALQRLGFEDLVALFRLAPLDVWFVFRLGTRRWASRDRQFADLKRLGDPC